MANILNEFALGLLNFVIGFGAGWFCLRASKREVERSSPAEPPDSTVIMNTVDEIEEAASDQEKSNRALKTLISGERIDVGHHLGVHIQANRQFGRLLEIYQKRLNREDPDHAFVPTKFTDGIGSSLQAVCLLTEKLENAEQHPDDSMSDLQDRLERLEASNTTLRAEIDSARCTIDEQANRLHAVETAAFEDYLTKLPNRRAFEHRFAELNSAFERDGSPFCMLLIDLDHFKNVNDTHGHECGDAVLAIVAHVIQEVCRGQDFVARYGGEEFAVLATETELQGARILAERIRSRVEITATRHADANVRITCSIGVAQIEASKSGTRLFELADTALYSAKESGRNQVRVQEPGREPNPV